ncbi:PLDc_N domain-containing protein [Actinomadura harenae]|uniref:PLDc_N domain-containing protein n=1 Tax=Actinomadura harenae TaxID=2483351 RepID=A0A3M2LTW1_9ACTN|nr:PLDc_N domain-containing protein [Actinomadura harenae]
MEVVVGEKRSWGELSVGQRRMIVGAAVVQWGLAIAALVDLRRRTAEEVRGSKRVWRVVAFVNFAGPLAYFLFGRRKRDG